MGKKRAPYHRPYLAIGMFLSLKKPRTSAFADARLWMLTSLNKSANINLSPPPSVSSLGELLLQAEKTTEEDKANEKQKVPFPCLLPLTNSESYCLADTHRLLHEEMHTAFNASEASVTLQPVWLHLCRKSTAPPWYAAQKSGAPPEDKPVQPWFSTNINNQECYFSNPNLYSLQLLALAHLFA